MKSACATCEHMQSMGYVYGTCLHPDGPVRVYDSRGKRDPHHPTGCPVDPNPKLVRVRPKKKRGPRPGTPHRPDAPAVNWECDGSPSAQTLRAPTIAEQETD